MGRERHNGDQTVLSHTMVTSVSCDTSKGRVSQSLEKYQTQAGYTPSCQYEAVMNKGTNLGKMLEDGAELGGLREVQVSFPSAGNR